MFTWATNRASMSKLTPMEVSRLECQDERANEPDPEIGKGGKGTKGRAFRIVGIGASPFSFSGLCNSCGAWAHKASACALLLL